MTTTDDLERAMQALINAARDYLELSDTDHAIDAAFDRAIIAAERQLDQHRSATAQQAHLFGDAG